MNLSVLIPVYNEEQYVDEIVKKVCSKKIVKEIIIINDGSTDRTREILEDLKTQDTRINVIHLPHNSGKGKALREGIPFISGDITLVQDADLEYSPDDYEKIMEPFMHPEVAVVYGSRMLKKGNKISSISYLAGGLLLTRITNMLYNARITDEPTCYKAFRSSLLKNIRLECEKFEFCPEVTAKVLRRGIRIHEVPISYCPRKISEGKKIRLQDGMMAVWTLIKYRFKN